MVDHVETIKQTLADEKDILWVQSHLVRMLKEYGGQPGVQIRLAVTVVQKS